MDDSFLGLVEIDFGFRDCNMFRNSKSKKLAAENFLLFMLESNCNWVDGNFSNFQKLILNRCRRVKSKSLSRSVIEITFLELSIGDDRKAIEPFLILFDKK